jgi:hypothetical protein
MLERALDARNPRRSVSPKGGDRFVTPRIKTLSHHRRQRRQIGLELTPRTHDSESNQSIVGQDPSLNRYTSVLIF